MTIAQAEYEYGTRDYVVTVNDTLTKIARKLYGEADDKTIRILKSLNTRFDWDNLRAGETIRYLDKANIDNISEIW